MECTASATRRVYYVERTILLYLHPTGYKYNHDIIHSGITHTHTHSLPEASMKYGLFLAQFGILLLYYCISISTVVGSAVNQEIFAVA